MLLGSSTGQSLKKLIARGFCEVVEFISSAIKSLLYATIAEHPAGPTLFDDCGTRLLERFVREDIQDTNDSTNCFDLALKISSDNQNWPSWLNNLAGAPITRFKQQNTMNDLNRTTKVLSTAIQQMSNDHPDRATMFENIGSRLHTWVYHLKKQSDRNIFLTAFTES